MALKTLSRDQLVRKIESTNVQAKRARDKVAQIGQKATHTAVAGGAAFLTAYLDSRIGGEKGVDVGPVPVPLLAGLALSAVGAMGLGGASSSIVLSAGQGTLAAALALEGSKAGIKAHKPA